MNFDVLILNSGEWVLGEEVAADSRYVLVYRQRGEPRNELHLCLPRADAHRSGDFAFKRFWVGESVRWCVELQEGTRLRFTAPDGHSRSALHRGAKGLGDLSDHELSSLLAVAYEGMTASA